MVPPPLTPSAVLRRRMRVANHTSGGCAEDGAGARLQQDMFITTRAQYPAKKRDTGS